MLLELHILLHSTCYNAYVRNLEGERERAIVIYSVHLPQRCGRRRKSAWMLAVKSDREIQAEKDEWRKDL